MIAAFDDNRARSVRCVHPLVTVIEKLDALHRRFSNEQASPPTFVRHYEDLARLIAARAALPPLDPYPTVRALADEMLSQKQIVAMPVVDDVALAPVDDARWAAIRRAHDAIGEMFWGPRIELEEATAAIRAWISTELA